MIIRDVTQIKISEIEINGNKIRQNLDSIDSLSENIRINGLLNPITVRKTLDGKYTLLSGFRRIKAIQKLGLKVIDANVLKYPSSFMSVFSSDKYDLFANPCEVCDYPITEIHHITPRHFGGTDKQDNLIHLCPTHHQVFDFLTKMRVFEDNSLLKKKRMETESKRAWKILLTHLRILAYDQKASTYFEEYVEPKLPQFLVPLDSELFKAYEEIDKDLKKQGKSTEQFSNEVLYEKVLAKIKEWRKAENES